MMRPLNSIIGVPGLIGSAANNPTLLIGDLRFCHSRFRRCSLIPSSHSFIDRILLFATVVPLRCVMLHAYSTHSLRYRCKHARISNRTTLYGTTPRQMQTSTQRSSTLRPRLAASAPGYQGYPTIQLADATGLFAVANCIRCRNTIAPGKVPFPQAIPCAWSAQVIQLLRMLGKAPFPCRDWLRFASSCQ